MTKFRRLLSFLLTLVMIVTAVTSTRMIVNASILPLPEINAYLVLNGYSEKEIKAMPLDKVLSLMQDKDGNYIEIPSTAKVVWAHFKDDTGSVIRDEYHMIGRDETVDLTEFEYTTGYTMELIVGSGNQLDAGNVRYIVKVYISGKYSEKFNFEFYTQAADNSRNKIEPLNIEFFETDYDKIVDINGNPISMWNYAVTVSEGDYGRLYLAFTSQLDEHPDVDLEIYELTDNELQNPITNKIMNQDMSISNSGYLMKDNNVGFIVGYYIDGVQVDAIIVNIFFSGQYSKVTGNVFTFDDSSKIDIAHKENQTILLDDDVYILEYVLKEGYSADAEYYLNLNAISGLNGNVNNKVTKAVIGHYDLIGDTVGLDDLKDQLFSDSTGYKANYSNKGIDLTIFFEDGAFDISGRYKLTIRTVNYNGKWVEFDDAPIVGAQDPWFRVDGVYYGSSALDTYIIENGKAINMDTMYGYGYQTILLNDKDVDLSQLKPTFWFGDANRVDTYVGSKQESGVSVQDFSNGSIQYGTIIDDNVKNYQVTFVKKETGPKLFVNGPETRTVFLDEYFEYKHDILIANVGDQPLTGLKVKLDATNVKLDDYWTVGGTGNDTLAAFTTTSTESKYGELANIAKIRLLPDGDGEVEGTLTISADDQKDVVITLTGRAANPTIITKELDDAVKYVPYSYLVSTDNMNDWNTVTFSIESGKLPEGLELYPTTGEIYGTPQESGEFTIRVKATYGRTDYFEPSYADLTLLVKENTNENVYEASDDGYEIKQSIGTETNQYEFILETIEDTVFTSYGEYDEFVDLWLNGEKLVEDTDYTKEEGSTKITIKSKTFENKANQKGTNTIAAEFRKNGDRDNDLKRTAQNFELDIKSSADKVIAKIAALPSDITLNDKEAVQAARDAYDALSKDERAKVTNYNKLTAAEAAIARLKEEQKEEQNNQEAVNKVINLIDAIPANITLGNKQSVSNARAAYDDLTVAQKKLITNYEELTKAESAITQLEKEQKEKEKNQAAADKVIDLINSIPSTVTLDNKKVVSKARTAYDDLTAAQKKIVTNYERLTRAESAITQLEEEQAENEKDMKAANKVIKLIDVLPSNITLNDKKAVSNARAAYDDLTKAQKKLVTNYERLTKAESAITQLEKGQAESNSDKDAASTVVELIDAFPSTITLNDKSAINNARAAYNALTASQKSYVTNYTRLTEVEKVITKLEGEAQEKAKINEAITLINAISDRVTLSDKNAVESARRAYDSLTDSQKAAVVNYNDLINAEATITALELQENANETEKSAANRVIDLISTIPKEITLEDKEVIENIRDAYETLTAEQKQLVTNYSDLTGAEDTIIALEEYEVASKEDKAAADEVIKMIDSLPIDIMLEDKALIESVREAYDALTESQKKIVTNYKTLEELEVIIAELELNDYEETQFATFVGLLVNSKGKALSDVIIEIHSAVQTVRTDNNGSFQFNNVEFGKHTIYVKDSDEKIISQKEFNIVLGTDLALNGNEITAQNGLVFTLEMQLNGDELTFLTVQEGNQAPIIDISKGNNNDDSINIGDSDNKNKNNNNEKKDSNGIDIGDSDTNNDSKSNRNQDNVSYPQTGDDSNLVLWYILLIASLAGLVITVGFVLKKNKVSSQ